MEAVAAGHRPSDVVPLDDARLDRLLTTGVRSRLDAPDWLDLVRRYEVETLTRTLRAEHERRGAIGFATSVVEPLLEAVREAWADGRLEVRHEHFLVELLHDHVRGARAAIGTLPAGPRLLLCLLGQTDCELSLQLAALIAAEKGFRVVVFGRDTPFDEVLPATTEVALDGVYAPIPIVLTSRDQEERLQRLRAAVPSRVDLCVGWPGARFARRIPRGVTVVRELSAYELWLRRLLRPRSEAQSA